MKPERYLRRAAPIAAVRWDGTAMGASQIIDWVIDGGGTATYYCSALRVCLGREDDSHTIRLTDPDVVTHAHPGWYIHQDPDDGAFHASPPADFEASHLPLAPPVDTGTSLFPSLDIPRPHHHGGNR